MSGLESVEKMRQAIGSPEMTYDGKPAGYSWYAKKLLDIADEIEREVSERFMELPVDADGVPIHVGDEMRFSDGEETTVMAVDDKGNVYHDGLPTIKAIPGAVSVADCMRHVEPRTVEDVLTDFAYCCEEGADDRPLDVRIDECAAELRGLMAKE